MKAGVPTPFFLFLVRPLLCPLSIHGCPFPVFLLLRSQVPHLRTPFGLSRQLPDKPESRQIDKPESWQPHHLPRTCHHLILRAPARRAHLLLPHLIALCNDCTMQSQYSVIAPRILSLSPPPPAAPLHRCARTSRAPPPHPADFPTSQQIDKPTSWQVGKLASWHAPPPIAAKPPTLYPPAPIT